VVQYPYPSTGYEYPAYVGDQCPYLERRIIELEALVRLQREALARKGVVL